MLGKLSLIFLTLFFVTSNILISSKIIRQNHGVSRLPVSPIVKNSAFIGLNRKKRLESNTPTEVKESRVTKNAVLSKLTQDKYKKLVLVAGGTALFTVTVYKFVSKLAHHYLYERYVTKDPPGVVKTLGHVLMENTPYTPSKDFMDKVFKPISKVLSKTPFLKGFLRPGLRRVSTSSLVDKDTYVLVYMYNNYVHDSMKALGVDYVSMVRSSYESLVKSGKNVKLVYVNMSNSYDECYESFKGMPWYSVPFGDKKLKMKLFTMFNNFHLPSVVLLDSEGNVVSQPCFNLLLYKVNDFPWKDLKFKDLLPEYLCNSLNESVPKSSLDGKFVGVFLDIGNPEVMAQMKDKIKSLYEYMDKVTNGNFKIINLDFSSKESDREKVLKQNNPEWLNFKLGDKMNALLLSEMLTLNDIQRFVLLDQEGNVYTKFGQYLLNDKLYEPLSKEYLRGSFRVKGDELAHCHLLSRPCLVVVADNEDNKSLENLDMELSKAYLTHTQKHKGSPFQFILLKNKNSCQYFRKYLKLNNKTQMVIIDPLNKVHKMEHNDLNHQNILKFIDNYYNSL